MFDLALSHACYNLGLMDAEIEAIAVVMRLMVDDPSSLTIQVVQNGGRFTIKVSAKDIRQLIGRQGRNAHALRTILNAMASKHGERVALDLTEVPSPAQDC